MKVNGHRSINKTLQHDATAPVEFTIGPIRFLAHLERNAVKPEFMLFINGGTYVKKFPINIDILAPQNYIDFKITECDDSFENFFVAHNNERIEIKLSHGNKKHRVYRLFPSGSVERLK